MTEGDAQFCKPRQRYRNDTSDDFIWLRQQVARMDAMNGNTLLGQPGIAHAVMCDLLVARIDFAIDFDRKLGLHAVKIENIGTDGVLAAKDKSGLMLTFQPTP